MLVPYHRFGLLSIVALFLTFISSAQSPTLYYSTTGKIETAISYQTFDMAPETFPSAIRFNNDGSKMYVAGSGLDNVYEFFLGPAYDVSSASISDTFNISGQEGAVTGLEFNADGSKMFIVGSASDLIYEYSITSFFLSSAVYSGNSFLVTEDQTPADLSFSNDGFTLFVLGNSNDNIFEYTLGTAYDITTAGYTGNFLDVSGEETGPTGFTFNANGTQLFLIGNGSDRIYQYNLSTGFDILTATYSGISFLVAEDASPEGMVLSNDGTQLFVVGAGNDNIYSYDLSANAFNETAANDGGILGSLIFRLSGEFFTNPGADLTNGPDYTIANLPSGYSPRISVSPDSASAELTLSGTAINHNQFDDISSLQFTFNNSAFVAGDAAGVIDAVGANSNLGVNFDLNPSPRMSYSTSADIATASFRNFLTVSGQENLPTGLTFNNNGSKMYIVGTSGDNVTEFVLGTNYDVTSATVNTTFFVGFEEGSSTGVTFNTSGTRMYITGFGQDIVNEYRLDNAFDISTASFTGNSLSIPQDNTPTDLAFSDDGFSLFVIGSGNDEVYEYTLSSAFDLSSASYSGNSLNISAQEVGPTALLFNANGSRLFIVGSSSDRVYQYNLSTGFDISSGVFSGVSFDVSAEDTAPQGLALDSAGTKLFVIGQLLDRVYEYDLSPNAFYESEANDGTLEGEMIVSLIGDSFNNPGSNLVEVTDYFVTNLPVGITPNLEISLDGLSGSLTYSGSTPSHDDLDDISNLQFSFEDPAFLSGAGELIANAVPGNSNLQVDFTANPSAELKYSLADNISTAVHLNSFSVSTEDTAPSGVAFNTDGSKMFMVGRISDDVNEYALASNYDVSTATLTTTFSNFFEESSVSGITFNPSGTRMYLSGFDDDEVNEYILQTAFDVSSASFTGKALSVISEDNSPTDLVFSSDGSKLFVLGSGSDRVLEYAVTVPYDISTATYSGNAFSVAGEETSPTGLIFNASGTRMFVVGSGSDRIFQYNLSTEFDIISAVFSGIELSVNTQELSPEGITLSNDGAQVFVIGSTSQNVHSYDLSRNAFLEVGANDGAVEGQLFLHLVSESFSNPGGTLIHTTDYTVDNLPTGLVPTLNVSSDGYSATLTLSGNSALNDDLDDVFDLQITFANSAFLGGDASLVTNAITGSSNFDINFSANISPEITYSQQVHVGGIGFNVSLDVSPEDGTMSDLVFNNDGSKLFTLGAANDRIYEYALGTNYDISSASLSTMRYVGFEDTTPTGIAFNKNGTRLYMLGLDSDLIHEYHLLTPFDVGSGSLSYTGKTLDVSGEETSPGGLTFSNDGNKLYVIGGSSDAIHEYDLSTPYEISTAIFFQSFSLASQDSSPIGVQFNANGTKMIVLGAGSDKIYSYSLSTAFDVSTSVFDGIEKNISLQALVPEGIALNATGTQFFVVGSANDDVSSYGLTQDAFVETAINDGALEGELIIGLAGDNFANPGGTLVHLTDYTVNNLPSGLTPTLTVNASGNTAVLSLSGNAGLNDDLDDVSDIQITFEDVAFSGGTAAASIANAVAGSSALTINFFDNPIAEVGYSSLIELGTSAFNSSFNLSAEDGNPNGLAFNRDGTKMFMIGAANARVFEYALSVGYDLSTATLIESRYIGYEESTPTGIAFNKEGSRMYVVGIDSDAIHEYLLRSPFDVSIGSFLYTGKTFNVLGQDAGSSDLSFSNDGSKLFLLGAINDNVYEYDLSIPYEITTSVFSTSFSVAAQENNASSFSFNADGTRLIMLGNGSDRIYSYDLSTGFDLTTAVYSGVSKNLATEDTAPDGLVFSGDGSKMFITGTVGDNVYSYDLSKSVFVETGANDGTVKGGLILSLASETFENPGGSLTHVTDYTIDNLPAGLVPDFTVSSDGSQAVLKFTGAAASNDALDGVGDIQLTFQNSSFVGGDASLVTNAIAGSSNLAIAFTDNLATEVSYSSSVEIGTAVFSGSFNTASEDGTMSALAFNNDGTKLFMIGAVNDRIYEYGLSLPYDVTSATLTTSRLIQFEETNPTGLTFNKSGSRLFVVGLTGDAVHEYLLSTPFDLSEGSFSYTGRSFDVSTEEASSSDIKFSSDGMKMYIIGSTSDSVHEYDLSTPYDITTAVIGSAFSVAPQDGAPVSIEFNANGTKMFMLGAGTDAIHSYDLSIGFDVSSAIYSEIEFSTNAEDLNPEGIFLDASGTRLFMVGASLDNVNAYNVTSSAFVEAGANDGAVQGELLLKLEGEMFEKPGGTLVHATDYSVDNVPIGLTPTLTVGSDGVLASLSFSGSALSHDDIDDVANIQITFLNTAFVGANASLVANAAGGSSNLGIDFATDLVPEIFYSSATIISKAPLVQSFNVSGEDTNPTDVTFNRDGTKMYVVGTANDNINQYDLATPYHVSSAVFSTSFSVGAGENFPSGMTFSSTGNRMYTVGFGEDQVDEYILSTPFDIGSAYYSGSSLDVNAEDANPVGIAFSSDGLTMLMIGSISDAIHEYQLSGPFDLKTAVLSGNSLSVATETNSPSGLTFSTDGYTLLVVGLNDQIHQYDLAIPFDLTTAVFSTIELNVPSEDLNAEGVSLSIDGTTLYMIGSSSDQVYQYDLGNRTFAETAENSGAVAGLMNINLVGDTFSAAGSSLTDGVDYTVDNLPVGLIPDVQVDLSGKVATLFLSGKSTSNEDIDDVADIQITFQGSAFIDNPAASISNAIGGSSGLAIDFNQNLVPTLNYASNGDIGSIGLSTQFSVASEEGSASDLAFNTDGSKAYIAGSSTDYIYEYDLSVNFDIGTAILVDSLSLEPEEGIVSGIAFNGSGTRVFTVGSSSAEIREFVLRIPFSISSASYSGEFFDFGTEDNSVKDIDFNEDGTRLYMVGDATNSLYQYNLGSPFDISTAIYSGVSLSVSSETTFPAGMDFNADGSKLVLVGGALYQYDLATNYDLGSASYSGLSYDVSTEDSFPEGVFYEKSGAKLFIMGRATASIIEYSLPNTVFAEAIANDGSVEGDLIITLVGDTFNNAGGTLTDVTDFSIANLPSGLTPIMSVNADGMSAILNFGASAISHDDPDDIADLQFVFNNAAFVGGNASIIANSTSTSGFGIDFIVNPPEPDVTITTIPLVDADVTQGDSDVLIYKFTFDILGGDVTSEGLAFEMGGTFLETDFGVDAFELSYNATSDAIEDAVSLGFSTYNSGEPAPPNTIGWAMSDVFTDGQQIFFYVTADIGPSAVVDGTFNVSLPDIENFGFSEPKNRIDGGLTIGQTFTIQPSDITPPIVTINSLSTSSRSPELTGTVDDATATIDIGVGGNNYAGANNGDGTWTLAAGTISPDLVDGVYDVMISGTDPASNVGTDGTVNELLVDATAPIVTINSSTTSIRSPELSGTVDDPTATIEVEVEGNLYPGTNNGDGTWILVEGTITPDLTDGTYDISIAAIDVLGNVGSDATTDELTISSNVVALPASAITSTSFQANWSTGLDVKEYRIDVSEEADFSSFVTGYEDFNAGTAIGLFVSPVDFSTSYYYRVRLVNTSDEVSANSNMRSVKTTIDTETTSDSTALVQIYNALGGSNWSPAVNWTTARLRDWDGVGLNSTRTRVEDVNITAVGAIGDMPNPFTGDAVGGLSLLLGLDASNNQITGLMDFSGTGVTNLNVSGNNLQFDDLEPIVGISSVDYSNQASIKFNEFVQGVDSILVNHMEDFLLTTSVGGSQNSYQWQRNGNTISAGADFAITGATANILSIDYDNMGEFSVAVTSPTLVPGLTIDVDPQLVLAIADLNISVLGTDGMPISESLSNAYLLEAFRRAKGFDTLVSVSNVPSEFSFPDLVLGNYLAAVDSDPLQYIATYFGDAFLWDRADTIFFRNDGEIEIRIVSNPPPGIGDGKVSGTVEENFADEGGRIDARRRAAKRKCGLRRKGGGGRTEADDDGFVLVAYGETNDNGEFEYGQLEEGTYRFFVEYPGIPLDPNAFVQFEIGEAGISQNEFVLAATVTENGIEVELIEALGVIHKYFKDLQIYPNPSSEVLNISYRHLTTAEVSVQLLDITGAVLYETDLSKGFDRDLRLDVSDYPEGLYLLRFYDKESSEKNMMSYRIIVRRE